jgi:two-component system, OmpR family, KDP operon response regulator KdpE
VKILIIEDSQELVNSLQLCFRIQWPEAKVVYTNLGMTGIQLATIEAPDIVVLDLGLPDIDGKDVLKNIRNTSNVPVIILSVRSEESDKRACFEVGANEYITKPFGAFNFIDTIKTTFARWQKQQGVI